MEKNRHRRSLLREGEASVHIRRTEVFEIDHGAGVHVLPEADNQQRVLGGLVLLVGIVRHGEYGACGLGTALVRAVAYG